MSPLSYQNKPLYLNKCDKFTLRHKIEGLSQLIMIFAMLIS